MPLPWFRMYHESRNDRKLDTLADDEFRVWHRLLCFASESAERGVIAAEDRMVLAIECARGDEELLARTLTRLVKLRIVTDEDTHVVFVNFVKRNYDKPSDTPTATRERKARQRGKARDTGVTETPSRDVTPRHAIEESRVEENRVEERRLDEGAAVLPLAQAPRPAPKRADARPPLPSASDLIATLTDWAAGKGVADILADEVDRFRDYCLAGKDGKPILYTDYAAACRKWITNPNYQHGPRPLARSSPNGLGAAFAPVGRDAERVAVMERFVARRQGQ